MTQPISDAYLLRLCDDLLGRNYSKVGDFDRLRTIATALKQRLSTTHIERGVGETEEITQARIDVCNAALICQGPFYTVDETQAIANLRYALRKLNRLLLAVTPSPARREADISGVQNMIRMLRHFAPMVEFDCDLNAVADKLEKLSAPPADSREAEVSRLCELFKDWNGPLGDLARAALAGPQPAQESRVTEGGQWIPVSERLPICDTTPNSFGVQVLVYPPYKDDGYSEMNCAFYGCRQTDDPNFYIYGRVFYPTHWMPLPSPPGQSEGSV